VMGRQTIVSRQTDLTVAPAVVTVGIFRGGVRSNIIPDEVDLEGTIRTHDEAVRDAIHARVALTAESIARAAGASAEVTIDRGNPVTYNDPDLTRRMVPTLQRVSPDARETSPKTVAEDFSLYQKVVPGLFVDLGVTPPEQDWTRAAPNHSPRFFADERALAAGVRVMANLAVDFLILE
jgi:metal-dependent amidase/aminoacylase/carboxypeptidase family protein